MFYIYKMFNTEEKIAKILGSNNYLNKKNMDMNPQNSFKFNGATSLSLNGQYNPNILINEIKKLFDKLPDVKEAKGNLHIKFKDGKQQLVNIRYHE